jgi:hypothetical protein
MDFETTFQYKEPLGKSRVPVAILLVIIPLMFSCKKLVETPVPTDQVSQNAVYTNDATAIAVLNKVYTDMNTAPFQGSLASGSVSLFAGLAADEYTLAQGITDQTYIAYYQNSLSQASATATGAEHWAPFYNLVFKCNDAIKGLTSSGADALTVAVKQQLIGEAEFMRAFFYFYLTNEYGDVPLALTTDPKVIAQLPRAKQADVYNQIISDLEDAETKLSENYLGVTLLATTSERVRPTKWAAAALLARVYLYTGDYAKSVAKATKVINNSTLFTLAPLNQVFLKNSKEAIFQVQPTSSNLNTQEGKTLIIPATGPSVGGTPNPVYLSKSLLNSFEPGDQRAVYGNWIDTTIYKKTQTISDTVAYPYKYKINASQGVTTAGGLAEYFMALRLGEQYLIRAEAKARLGGDPGGAVSDLNAIRQRAGLAAYSGPTDQASLLTAILHERQVELFSEWGHRWFDLKRFGKIDAVMSVVTPLKANGKPWQSFQQWFPIPLADIQKSPNLTQNTGY